MESEKKYLNEEKYQKTNKKVKVAGIILLILGIIAILAAIGLAIYVFTSGNVDENIVLFILGTLPLIFVGAVMLSFGMLVEYMGHAREINAYMTQQQIPVVKETVEEMTPIAKESAEEMAPAMGTIAKEITKGIKEGLKDEEGK